MLLRCCLIHISIIILRHFLYLLYLCSCLDLGLFMSYLCDLFFIFIFIFIIIDHIISWIQTHLFFCLFSRICPNIFARAMWIIFKQQNFSLRVLLSICLIFCQFKPGVAYKSVASIKKHVCDLNWKAFLKQLTQILLFSVEAVVLRCSSKYVFLKTSQISQDNPCVGVSF